MDGNFQAKYMRMRNPENDVLLSEGTEFIYGQQCYQTDCPSCLLCFI